MKVYGMRARVRVQVALYSAVCKGRVCEASL